MRFKSITGLCPSEQSNLWVQGLERVFIISFFCVKLNFLENLECRSNLEILTTYHCSASLFFSCMSLSISSWTVSYFSWILEFKVDQFRHHIMPHVVWYLYSAELGTHLLLYQASSLSRMRRKFLSSGRLNCSHCISPGSFSWRKKSVCRLQYNATELANR